MMSELIFEAAAQAQPSSSSSHDGSELEDVFEKNETKTDFYANKMWLQCENDCCLKWRLVSKEEARFIDLSKPWYCHLNTDPWFNDCSIPEEPFPEDSHFSKDGFSLIYSNFPMGSLVMVNLKHWPSWPAIICVNPVNGQELTHFKYYHVEYLGEPHTRSLVSLECVSPYHYPKETKYQKREYEKKKNVMPAKAKKRRSSSFHVKKDVSLTQSSEMCEAENILLDLGKILQEVGQPFGITENVPYETQGTLQSSAAEDFRDDADCAIIDGEEFWSGESFEAIAKNLEEIDCLFSEL
ncbi:zinc finger CW-type PWWP domain protein 2 isoform X2 [Hyperolius riggenbachi]|uniref:zinc finger CW-type PWWP domain protein 2 isoform X2 n=1 Tax=Hyperolius riggenbachi TaxID=752182 RepID=UPI0035A34C34